MVVSVVMVVAMVVAVVLAVVVAVVVAVQMVVVSGSGQTRLGGRGKIQNGKES